LRFYLDGRLLGERPLPQAELDAWVAQIERDYRALGVDLLRLGRRLHDWLDGPTERWIEQARNLNGELALHIDTAARLRHLPWELLADAIGHLCANPLRPFTPVRGTGAMQGSWPSENRPLRVLFMACSPLDVEPVLAFEKEEAWILAACAKSKEQIELVVEESGTLEGLTYQLRAFGPNYFDVVHLTGHAAVRDGRAIFLTEDACGRQAPCAALELAKAFEGSWPKLLFLSGCQTGQALSAGAAPSLCEAMVDAGAPAVLGWALPVADVAASALAAALYSDLAVGKRVDEAVARSRQQLFEDRFPHWHLLRLYGNSTPLGAAVTPPKTHGRKRLVIRPADKEFLDAKAHQTGEVCPRERFVGRRRALQRTLRVLVSHQPDAEYHEGVLISGMGGLGKSSLAARLCERMQGHRRLVLAGLVDDAKLNFVINDRLGTPEVLEIQNQPGLPLKQRLQLLLAGPLAGTPVLFVFDDFEQNLDVDAPGGCRCRPEPLEVLRAVLAAIRETSSDSRAIVTCRYRFPLPAPLSLYPEGLESLRGADLDKKLGSLDALSPTAKTNASLRKRAIELAAGNPRLLEWLERILSAASDDAAAIFAALEGKAEEFRENVLLDALLQRQTPEFRRLLAHLAQHALPIDRPTLVATLGGETIAGAPIDRDLVRGVALGLVESAPDAASRESKYFVSPIVAPLLAGELTADERADAQGRAARHLQCAWASSGGASEEESLEIIRLALEARELRTAVYVADRVATRWINRSRFTDAEQLCRRVLDVGDDFRIAHRLARAEEVLGKTEQALDRFESALAACPVPETGSPPEVLRERAAILHNMANLLAWQGQIERAMDLWRQSLEIKEQIGEARGKASTLHSMAGVLAQQGKIDRAMDLWRQSLEIDNEIGSVQGKAATLHEMAGVLAQQGKFDRAIELWRQSLEIIEQFGNVRGKAATLHNMGSVLAQQGQIERAMDLWRQSLEINEQIGEARGKSATLHQMAGVLADQGQIDRAMDLWRQSLEIDEQIGDVRGQAATLHQMAGVLANQGQIECAMDLWRQSLEIEVKIGNVQGKAATLANMAWAANKSGDFSEVSSLSHNAAVALAAARHWPDLATVIQNLGGYDQANCARYLAQALWLVLRLQSPSLGSANAARLLQAVGVEAPAAPLLAAAALWLAQREVGEQQSESQDLAQRMLAACAAQRGIPPEESNAWVEREGLLDPARFLPELDRALEALVGDDGWLFDRSLVDLPPGGGEAP
jgi:tetratricopeptide (TPR) repeat protein